MEINSNNSSNNSKPSAQIAVNNQSFLIYVVDDQTINLDIIRVFLSNNDFQVITEIDIRKAIQEIKSVQPDLILLDVVMPEINGFEACRLLKSSAETKDIPIIFLTALDDAENQIKGIKLGAFDYITKPIKLSELLTRVNSCFHIVNLTRNLQQQSTILKAEIVAKQKAQFALEESEKTLKSIINNSPHGIIQRKTIKIRPYGG